MNSEYQPLLKEIRNTGRECKTTMLSFNSDKVLTYKQKVFIENVEAKLTKSGN